MKDPNFNQTNEFNRHMIRKSYEVLSSTPGTKAHDLLLEWRKKWAMGDDGIHSEGEFRELLGRLESEPDSRM